MRYRIPQFIIPGDWKQGSFHSPVALPKTKHYNFASHDGIPQTDTDIENILAAYAQVKLVKACGPPYRRAITKASIDPLPQSLIERSLASFKASPTIEPPPKLANPFEFPPELQLLIHSANVAQLWNWFHRQPGMLVGMYEELVDKCMSGYPESIRMHVQKQLLAAKRQVFYLRGSMARRDSPKHVRAVVLSAMQHLQSAFSLPGPGKPVKGEIEYTPSGMPLNGSQIWGNMAFNTIPLPLRIRRPKSVKRAFVGAPCYIHRYVTDGMMFRLQKRSVSGTILVDVSGSMSLTSEHVAEAIRQKPLATVAVYSGDDCKEGHLTVIAKNGRMFDPSQHGFPGGNTVDGLALDWLATQAAPRVWICDGRITHPNGTHEQAREYCNRVTNAARITRYHRFDDYLNETDPLFSL